VVGRPLGRGVHPVDLGLELRQRVQSGLEAGASRDRPPSSGRARWSSPAARPATGPRRVPCRASVSRRCAAAGRRSLHQACRHGTDGFQFRWTQVLLPFPDRLTTAAGRTGPLRPEVPDQGPTAACGLVVLPQHRESGKCIAPVTPLGPDPGLRPWPRPWSAPGQQRGVDRPGVKLPQSGRHHLDISCPRCRPGNSTPL
jgi:hypothetical protein